MGSVGKTVDIATAFNNFISSMGSRALTSIDITEFASRVLDNAPNNTTISTPTNIYKYLFGKIFKSIVMKIVIHVTINAITPIMFLDNLPNFMLTPLYNRLYYDIKSLIFQGFRVINTK